MKNLHRDPGQASAAALLYLALVPIAVAFLPLMGMSQFYPTQVALCASLTLVIVYLWLAARRKLRSDSESSSVSALARVREFTSSMEPITKLGANADLHRAKLAIVEAARLSMQTDMIALFTIDPLLASITCDCTTSTSEGIKEAFLTLYERRITDPSIKDVWIIDDVDSVLPDSGARCVLIKNGVKSIAACPIRSNASVCGAIAVFYTDPLRRPEEALLLLDILTSHAATALSYSASLEQSQNMLEGLYGKNQVLSQQATVDGLTGLPNHRTFQQTLSELCRTSLGKNGRPISLAMVDVDHFKIYNDTHGHPEGDSVLREAANLMTAGLREEDFVARYGGEEFAILFNGTSKESACIAAERIRKTIAEHVFDNGSLTVSMGVAEFPLDTSDPGEFIELADKALYHAKSIGRNRVFGWGTATSVSCSTERHDDSGTQEIAVLVVEACDETCAADVSGAMLDSCIVTSVSSIVEALDTLKSRAYDICLVSTNILPDKNIRHISSLAAIHSKMPIVLVADNLPAQDCREALRRGAADIITRPYNPLGFPVLIERNLERQRMQLQRLMQKSTDVMLQAIEALVSAIDAKDPHTAGHSHRVTELTSSLSDKMGISHEERYALELASKLHDIGKLALPDSALNKSTPLTDADCQAMREHPVVGAKIVGAISELAYVSSIIRHHHERLDGSGYPDGLSGSAIPYLSRILAVADTYEALTAERADRNPLSPTKAIAELRQGSGTLYESRIVDILEKQLCMQGDIPYRTQPAKAA